MKERQALMAKQHAEYEKDLKQKSVRYLKKIEDAQQRRMDLQAEGPLF